MVSLFERELAGLINRYSVDASCNTPDFMLAAYLNDCLTAYRKITAWHGLWESSDGVPEALRETGPASESLRA